MVAPAFVPVMHNTSNLMLLGQPPKYSILFKALSHNLLGKPEQASDVHYTSSHPFPPPSVRTLTMCVSVTSSTLSSPVNTSGHTCVARLERPTLGKHSENPRQLRQEPALLAPAHTSRGLLTFGILVLPTNHRARFVSVALSFLFFIPWNHHWGRANEWIKVECLVLLSHGL